MHAEAAGAQRRHHQRLHLQRDGAEQRLAEHVGHALAEAAAQRDEEHELRVECALRGHGHHARVVHRAQRGRLRTDQPLNGSGSPHRPTWKSGPQVRSSELPRPEVRLNCESQTTTHAVNGLSSSNFWRRF